MPSPPPRRKHATSRYAPPRLATSRDALSPAPPTPHALHARWSTMTRALFVGVFLLSPSALTLSNAYPPSSPRPPGLHQPTTASASNAGNPSITAALGRHLPAVAAGVAWRCVFFCMESEDHVRVSAFMRPRPPRTSHPAAYNGGRVLLLVVHAMLCPSRLLRATPHT